MARRSYYIKATPSGKVRKGLAIHESSDCAGLGNGRFLQRGEPGPNGFPSWQQVKQIDARQAAALRRKGHPSCKRCRGMK